MPLMGYIYGTDRTTGELRVKGPYTSERMLVLNSGHLAGERRVDLSTPNLARATEEIKAGIRTGALKSPEDVEYQEEDHIRSYGREEKGQQKAGQGLKGGLRRLVGLGKDKTPGEAQKEGRDAWSKPEGQEQGSRR